MKTSSIRFILSTAAVALAGAFGSVWAQTDDSAAMDQSSQAQTTQMQQPAASGGGVKGYLSRMWHSERASPEKAEIDAGNKAAPTNAHGWRHDQSTSQGMTEESNAPQQDQQDQQ